jgi:hypothetical protein
MLRFIVYLPNIESNIGVNDCCGAIIVGGTITVLPIVCP